MSFWISIAVVLAVYELHASSILVVFGVSGGASLTERFLRAGINEEDGNDD
jgi:hypothetical protein